MKIKKNILHVRINPREKKRCEAVFCPKLAVMFPASVSDFHDYCLSSTATHTQHVIHAHIPIYKSVD